MKSFSKRVASFAMAAAMVLSLAAVSPVDAEAATAKITKKSSITAGKTYTYNVKNVTKSQYIKVRMSSGVTVKYNNKTVKKNSTKIKGGKTIALKVKAADKVANYKATVKAVIYNKKTNKKVKTLTTQSTVKCTALKVTDVTVASNSGKYLVATFNKTLTKLSVADIEVRKLNTNELKGIEKVELSSDGKSATVTLVGSEDNNNQFVEPNIEYSFTVSQSGAKATTNFTVDAVKAYVTIDEVNPSTKTVHYTKPNKKNTNELPEAAGTVTLREDVCADDFQDLLGRTVTVWYNRNNVATKLTKANETIIYGAFKYVTSNTATPYYENRATGDKYYVQNQSGDVDATKQINLRANNSVANVNGELVDYAKLVLYSNGNVRAMVYNKTYTDKLLVTEVKDTVVYSGTKTAMNLKDYLILKDGKAAKIADIQKDDVVFVDSANKFAEIYTSSKTGDLQAVYDDQYKFGDVTYLRANVKVIKDNAVATPNNDYMKSLFKGGPAVTVYFDRAGQPAFITGTPKGSDSSTDVVVLTENGNEYKSALSNVIRVKGYNGKETKTYDIDLADLASVYKVDTIGTAKKWYVDGTVGGDTTDAVASKANYAVKKVAGFVPQGTTFTDATDGNGAVDTKTTGTSIFASTATDFAKFKVVELTKNASGKVTDISMKFDVTTTIMGSETDFVAGKTQYGTYLISKSTPVYMYDTKNNVVSKINYEAYTGSKAIAGNVNFYTGSYEGNREISYVVVKNAGGVVAKTVSAVVGSVVKVDGKITNLVAINGSTATEYTAFFNEGVAKTANVAAGKVVTLGLAADEKTIVTMTVGTPTTSTVSVSANAVNQAEGKFLLAGGTELTVAPTGYTVVLKKTNAQGIITYEAVAFNELATLTASNSIEYNQLTSGYVDVIIINQK